MVEAIKNDDKKIRVDLFPTKALIGSSRALTHGIKKYSEYNYKKGDGLDWNRPYGATLRHLIAWWDGENIDRDSGLHHLDCAGAEIAMLMDLVYSQIGKDTRYKRDSTQEVHDLNDK